MITRGSTPTLTYEITELDLSTITDFRIDISQRNSLKASKYMRDCVVDVEHGLIECTLTEEETLRLDDRYPCESQIAFASGNIRFYSEVLQDDTGRILNEERL